ncbi:MAG: hypothetical protein ACI4EU_03030 [Butyrivibrio sp.]
MWAWFGSYGISSNLVAIDIAMNGKKAKAKYQKEPITSQNEHKELSEDELMREEIRKADKWMEADIKNDLPETII